MGPFPSYGRKGLFYANKEVALIGLFIPTHGRPDLVRSSLLQFTVQTTKPDLIVVHQNGDPRSYEFITKDIKWPFELIWIHNPLPIRQHRWYSVPLKTLIERDCEYYFWIDHDDIYDSNHITISVGELKSGYDFRISTFVNQLTVDKSSYRARKCFRFNVHAPGGMSSSMAFNKKFAQELLKDLEEDTKFYYSDALLASVTMPKFKCLMSKSCTSTYFCHKGSFSSAHWVDDILKKSS